MGSRVLRHRYRAVCSLADNASPDGSMAPSPTRITAPALIPEPGEEIEKREVVQRITNTGRGQFPHPHRRERKALDVETQDFVDLEKLCNNPGGDI